MVDYQSNEEFPEYYRVTDTLDLHGFFPEQIPEVVQEFIRNALDLKLTRVQIIHGKGRSKLKYLVRKELQSHADVIEFADARPESGGWGRTLVLLRSQP